MKGFFSFHLFLFRTRLAKAFGCVALAVALAAGYVGQRVKVFNLLTETGKLEEQKQKLEENIAYLEEDLARISSVEQLEPEALRLGLAYPRLGQLGKLPLRPAPDGEMWRRAADRRGLLARLRRVLPFREAEVAAQEFKNGP